MKTLSYLVVAATVAFGASNALAQSAAEPAYGPELQGFDYPYPVEHYRFSSQGQELDMAYLDVKPSTPNGQTAVLLHETSHKQGGRSDRYERRSLEDS